ncbi:hypothetical protein V9T40_006125 [Parthenolecanium corni]|uniref:Uncharacterized protein n=1 Tax=Parthenolecanium corni TaxID=536013 RepID=A0AAN9YB28_9HEMI
MHHAQLVRPQLIDSLNFQTKRREKYSKPRRLNAREYGNAKRAAERSARAPDPNCAAHSPTFVVAFAFHRLDIDLEPVAARPPTVWRGRCSLLPLAPSTARCWSRAPRRLRLTLASQSPISRTASAPTVSFASRRLHIWLDVSDLHAHSQCRRLRHLLGLSIAPVAVPPTPCATPSSPPSSMATYSTNLL